MEVVQTRIAAYCATYKVKVNAEGFPPFPSGKRETAQHRQWIALYNAHKRVSRHEQGASPEELGSLLEGQDGRCPVCDDPLDLASGFCDIEGGTSVGVLHARCLELVTLARDLGPKTLPRVRRYLAGTASAARRSSGS